MEPCHWYMTMAVQEQPCHGDMAVQWQPHHGREPNRIRLWQTRRMRARTNASMAVAMQEVPAPPHSQVQGIGWGVLARTFAGPKTLVSLDLGSDSLELADCMVDPRKTYGEMRQACGCMGKPRYRMGRRSMCGEAAESHGERKSHEKPEYGSGRWRLGMVAAGPHGEPVPMADLA